SDGGGLLHLPPQWRRFRSWVPEEGGLASSAPGAVAFDADGALWSGGSDGLIEHIDPDNGAARSVLQADDGWPDQQVTGLLVQGDTLYVGTRRGLLIHALQRPGSSPRILSAREKDPQSP